jgi:hypothetical protein
MVHKTTHRGAPVSVERLKIQKPLVALASGGGSCRHPHSARESLEGDGRTKQEKKKTLEKNEEKRQKKR